jgi:hypothetical protein
MPSPLSRRLAKLSERKCERSMRVDMILSQKWRRIREKEGEGK